MKKRQTIAVFGLGRYGRAVARELTVQGADVIGVDRDPGLVNEAAAYLPVCQCADVTDAAVLEKLGIRNVDTVIIAMAESLEASVMTAMLCKEAGVREVIVKCRNEMHEKILLRIGADRVVFPERESGIRLARNLLSSGFIDWMELGGKAAIAELAVRPDWAGKSLMELRLRERYGINVVALRRGGAVDMAIDPTAPLKEDIGLIAVADTEKLRKLH